MKGCKIMAQCNLPECNVDHKTDKNTLKEHNKIAENRFKNSSHSEDFGSIANTSNSFSAPYDIYDDDLEDYYYDQAQESIEDIDLQYGTIYYEGYEPKGGTTGADDFLTEYAANRTDGYGDNDRVVVKFQIPGGHDEDMLQANKDYLEDFPDAEEMQGVKGEIDDQRGTYSYTFKNFDHLQQNKRTVAQMSNMITSTHEGYPVFSDEYYNNVTGREDEAEREMQREAAYEAAGKDFYEGEGHELLANAVKERVESTGHTFDRRKFDDWLSSPEGESAQMGYYDANGSYEMFFPDEDTGETVIQKRNFDSFFNRHGDEYVRGYMNSDDSIAMEGLRRNTSNQEYSASDIQGSDSWSQEDLERFFNQR